jgi:CDP-diacylglycerol--glycerol-3-phosphate 3-phosphatidyltransferase
MALMASRNCWRQRCSSPLRSPTALTDTSRAAAARSQPWECCWIPWPSLVPAWVAVVIIAREFLVSGLRSIAASEGFTIEASELGKFKMLVQIVSVVAVILDHRWKVWPVGPYIFPVHWIALVSIWFMVFLSLVSAIDYFAAFWSKIDRHVVKRRRRAFVLSRRRKRDVPAT